MSVIMTAMFVLGMLLIVTSAALVAPRVWAMEAALAKRDHENAALLHKLELVYQQMADEDRLVLTLRALKRTDCPDP